MAVLLALVICPAGFASGPNSFAGAGSRAISHSLPVAQQTVSLVQGWNLVSLSVAPTDPAMSSILAGVLSDIVIVKNNGGQIFSPEYGIYMIASWNPKEAYMIYARNPVSFTVSGSPIAPGQLPIQLNTGWYLVPYVLDAELPIDQALNSVSQFLIVAKNAAGEIYYPEYGVNTIGNMKPGQGYKLYLSQAATLLYPGQSNPDPSITVNTMAEATALRGLTPGTQVNVLGYYVPGDGGQGTFNVTESGCQTDGGTCFALDEFVKRDGDFTFFRETINSGRTGFVQLPHVNLVFGSIRIYAGDGSGKYVDDIELHGHVFSPQRGPTYPLIDHKKGTIRDYYWGIWNIVNANQGRVTYAYTTSNLRLERLITDNRVPIEAFGARRLDESSPTDIHDHICWAINSASRNGIPTVYFAGRYYYYGTIEIKNGVTLQGAGIDISELKVMPGKAMESWRIGASPTNRSKLDASWTAIFAASEAAFVAIKDIELDGNAAQNKEIFTNPTLYGDGSGDLKPILQDAPIWNGIVTTVHGGRTVPVGQSVLIENVDVHDFGGNCILGDRNTDFVGNHVKVGNCVRNHAMYEANGIWTDLTVYGYAWGSFLDLSSGTIYDLKYENGALNPYFGYGYLVNYRGLDPTQIGPNPSMPRHLGLTIDGFDLNLAGSNVGVPFAGIGYSYHVRNGTVYLDPDKGALLYKENANGYQTGLYHDNVFENITMVETGRGNASIMGNIPSFLNTSVFKGVTIQKSNTVQPSGSDFDFYFWLAKRNDLDTWLGKTQFKNPQQIDISDINDPSPKAYILKTSIKPESAELTIFMRNSKFNNQTNSIFINESHTGKVSQLGGDPSKIKVYLENVEFNLGMNQSWEDLEMFFTLSSFKNCKAVNINRLSEDSGTVSYTARGGETYIDIPTKLFWAPLASSIQVTPQDTRSSIVRTVEVTGVSGGDKRYPGLRVQLSRALVSGEVVKYQWQAAVKPF